MTSTQDTQQPAQTENAQAQSEGQFHVHGPNCNHHHALMPIVRALPKIGRNDPCSCGSTKKFKKCCGSNLQ